MSDKWVLIFPVALIIVVIFSVTNWIYNELITVSEEKKDIRKVELSHDLSQQEINGKLLVIYYIKEEGVKCAKLNNDSFDCWKVEE